MDDSYNNHDIDDVDDDIKRRRLRRDGGGGCLSQNFVLAYNCYWMEVDINNIDGASLLLPSSSLSPWGTCQGAHPVLTLAVASGRGATTNFMQSTN